MSTHTKHVFYWNYAIDIAITFKRLLNYEREMRSQWQNVHLVARVRGVGETISTLKIGLLSLIRGSATYHL